ncbi:MAG: SpoIID/LytB domain-containing protein [Desulfobacterales bacterium]|uniref:SpoIID/LytB domain-containing protein n=1 Tax=Candidatus Desulfaltia bathyphila TaxID=2841697 RepID=A0A8J6TBV1_9BACT|nr:SpoIID/LytB domain-containing protein [Candidatus Desulfaltia bathyphila]MBL7207380.1 SpoIID/LytB domain-containing protein [Desulfobacterales bacterium]
MLKKPVSIFFLCFFCLFFVYAEETAIAAYNDVRGFKTAARLLNNGMYLEALSIYQEISDYSDKQDNRARALLFMGTTYSLYLDQYDVALKQFDKIIKTCPTSHAASDAVFNSGMVLYETGKFKRAHAFFKKYLEKYPYGLRRQSAEVWADSAKAQMSQIRKPEVITAAPLYKRDVEDTNIRVLIKNRAEKITVYSEQNISLHNPFSKKMIYRSSGPVTFTKQGKQLAANGRKLDLHMCMVKTDGKTIMVDNRRFRGDLTILADSKSLSVINNIPVEQYLYGVVPKEMPPNWAKEALKAQAVAARTYALYIKDKSADKPYDVESTTTSQVYGGFDSEKKESNLAVDETRSQVITYNGKLIVAYFHSSSGGHTEDSKNVWSADLPYLKGVPDSFSANIPNGEWKFFVSYNDMQNRLNKYGLNIGQIRGLNAAGESRSGRLLGVRVIAKNGTTELKSNNFRIKVGATRLKSTLLKITPDHDGILFIGKGYGHGVGMSQWGANMMAQKGFGCQDILKHYYQSVKIVTLSSQ